jgi:hypothetical protein
LHYNLVANSTFHKLRHKNDNAIIFEVELWYKD